MFFYKNRTKKPLSIQDQGVPAALRKLSKSFLLLFFKKEELSLALQIGIREERRGRTESNRTT
jgi:hypothetical protein